MNLTKEIEIVDLALLINKNTLVISDIHLGYEEALIHQGYLIPRHQYKDILERLNNILNKTKPVDELPSCNLLVKKDIFLKNLLLIFQN